MTTKTLTVVSWTARIFAVVVLLLLFSGALCFDSHPRSLEGFNYALVLLGIAAIPSRVLSRHRILSVIAALCVSILSLLFLAGLVVLMRECGPDWSSGWWRDVGNLLVLTLFFILIIGVCSLPVALATADALARRGDPVRALGKWARIVLLACGSMMLILVTWLLA